MLPIISGAILWKADMGARETALNALIACRKEGAWSNGVLKEYLVRDD